MSSILKLGAPPALAPEPHEVVLSNVPIFSTEKMKRLFAAQNITTLILKDGVVSQTLDALVIVQRLPAMVEIINTQLLTATRIDKFLRHCGFSLITLKCVNVPLEDDFIETLSNYCPNLQMLHLQDCKHITNLAIEMLTESDLQLEILHVSWCPKITNHAFVDLAQIYNGLHGLFISKVAGNAQLKDKTELAGQVYQLEKVCQLKQKEEIIEEIEQWSPDLKSKFLKTVRLYGINADISFGLFIYFVKLTIRTQFDFYSDEEPEPLPEQLKLPRIVFER